VTGSNCVWVREGCVWVVVVSTAAAESVPVEVVGEGKLEPGVSVILVY